MLVINNVENFVCNDDAVASSKSVLNTAREVESLFNEHHRITAELLGTFILFENVISIFFRTILHFTTVVGEAFCWISYITTESFLHKVSTEFMAVGSFLCIRRGLIFDSFTELSGRWTVDPSMRS